MPRKAVVNQREITEDGIVQVRIAKQIVDDGEVISITWHRAAFPPGCDVEGVITGVDNNLSGMGFGAVVDWSAVRATVAAEHTPEVIQAYQDAQAAAQAARDAERAA